MKSLNDLGFNNTLKVILEAKSYQNEMNKQIKKSQKECDKRDTQKKKETIKNLLNRKEFLVNVLNK